MQHDTDHPSAVESGHRVALGELYTSLYNELRRLAHAKVRRSGDLTLLDTTALVHESYLRLEKAGNLLFTDRGQFMAYAAQVMRSVVVDIVRARSADRRGGDAAHVEFDEEGPLPARLSIDDEVLRVHEALEELANIDVRMVQVVELRYFAGMTEPEIADALGVGLRTVSRDWEKARLFLHASLR